MITERQISFISSLVARSERNERTWEILQAAYDETNTDGWKVTQSGYRKHVLRHLTREQASQMIDDLQAL